MCVLLSASTVHPNEYFNTENTVTAYSTVVQKDLIQKIKKIKKIGLFVLLAAQQTFPTLFNLLKLVTAYRSEGKLNLSSLPK